MKVYDITNIIYNGDHKPEISHIYVKHTEGGIVYVATNAFALIEVTVNYSNIKDVIEEGFYSKKDWKLLCKELKKSIPDSELILSISPVNKDYIFTEYEKLFPQETIDVTIPANKLDPILMQSLCKTIKNITKEPIVRIVKDFTQDNSKDALYYEKKLGVQKIRAIIMCLN